MQKLKLFFSWTNKFQLNIKTSGNEVITFNGIGSVKVTLKSTDGKAVDKLLKEVMFVPTTQKFAFLSEPNRKWEICTL